MAAPGKPATYDEAFGILPPLQLQELLHYAGEFLSERFDRSLYDSGTTRIAICEQCIQALFGDLARKLFAKRASRCGKSARTRQFIDN
jgi:hypothetical protein